MPGNEEILWENQESLSPADLLARVRLLELTARKNAYNYLQGNYITKVKGKGLDFHEARKYVYGEPIRQIDWNMTARMREPYVREFNEEREREIFIVIDISPSMHTGWQRLRKIEHAVELASSLACSTVSSGDRLGYVTYSDRVHDFSPPVKGKVQLFLALKTFLGRALAEPAPCDVSDMRQAIYRIQGLRGKRFLIFFLSDFIDFDIPDDLRYLQARHEVSLFHIFDPFEYDRLAGVSFLSSPAEGLLKPGVTRPGTAGDFAKITADLGKIAGSYGIRYKPLSTKYPVRHNLHELFHFIKRRGRK